MCFIEEEVQEKVRPEVVALPVWLGMRLWDKSDLDEFLSQFSYNRGFASYNVQDLSEVDVKQDHGLSYLSEVRNLLNGIKEILKGADAKVAIFYIVTGQVAESNWFPILKKLVVKSCPGHLAYTVVVGGGLKSRWDKRDRSNPYDPEEIRAHELGAICSSFDSDAPTAGIKRLMETLNRIMGADLPEQKFPDYTEEELRQLAWHVCRENFNAFSAREGSIPKYKIDQNGRPIFKVRKPAKKKQAVQKETPIADPRNPNRRQPSFSEVEEKREYLEDISRRHERFPYALWKIAKAGEEWFGWIKQAQKTASEQEKSPEEVQVWFRSLAEIQDSEHGFIQAHADEFSLDSYMEALYDDEIRARHYFPEPCRSDLEPIKVGGELEGRVQFLKTGEHFYHKHVGFINEKPKHLREFSGRFMEVFQSLHVGNGFRHCSNHINFLEQYDGTHHEDDAFVLPPEEEKTFLESVVSVTSLGSRKVPNIPRDAENWFFTNGWSTFHPAFLLEFGDTRPPMIAYMSNGIMGQAYEEGELLIEEQKQR